MKKLLVIFVVIGTTIWAVANFGPRGILLLVFIVVALWDWHLKFGGFDNYDSTKDPDNPDYGHTPGVKYMPEVAPKVTPEVTPEVTGQVTSQVKAQALWFDPKISYALPPSHTTESTLPPTT